MCYIRFNYTICILSFHLNGVIIWVCYCWRKKGARSISPCRIISWANVTFISVRALKEKAVNMSLVQQFGSKAIPNILSMYLLVSLWVSLEDYFIPNMMPPLQIPSSSLPRRDQIYLLLA